MSYNPARVDPQVRQRQAQQRRQNPHAGVKHSTIVGRDGPRGINVADIRNRQSTERGWRVATFKGDDFEMIYEYICARNSTGQIKNEDQDRAIRVLAGMIYVTIDGQVNEIQTGQGFAIPKGTVYELATSGTTDAEVLFCQGPDYDKSIEQVSEAVKNNAVNVVPEPQAAPIVRTPRRKPQAQMAAERIEAQRAKRAAKKQQVADPGTPRDERPPLATQQVVGVNPKPVGAGGYADDPE